MNAPTWPEALDAGALSVVIAPGPRPDPGQDMARLARHREFYLKSPHTVVRSGSRLRHRPALGRLSYRAQLGLIFEPTPRHTPPERILERVRGVVLAAELVSIDLLRVGWEGTMWHVRYGEGASFDDSCVVADRLIDAGDVIGREVHIVDAAGDGRVGWSEVAEFCAYVSGWLELRPDSLLLAGSRHGPVLSTDGADAVIRFPDEEPRLGPGDEVLASSPQLGEVRATITSAEGEG